MSQFSSSDDPETLILGLLSLDQNSLDVYNTRLSSAAESAKEKVLVGVEEYKGRLSSLANSAKESASKVYEDAQAVGTDWDKYKGRVASLAETVQEAGMRRAEDFRAHGMEPVLHVYREGLKRHKKNLLSSLKSMSMNRAKRARMWLSPHISHNKKVHLPYISFSHRFFIAHIYIRYCTSHHVTSSEPSTMIHLSTQQTAFLIPPFMLIMTQS